MQRYTHHGLTWIDLETPTRNEVRELVDEFGIDSLVADELLLPTAKPRFERHENMLYLILHFPALHHTHHSAEQEIDFVVGKEFIITTRYDMIDPLHKFSKTFEVGEMTGTSGIGDHAGYILYFILRSLYVAVDHEVEYVRTSLHDIEEQVFEGREKEMVAAISHAGRDLLALRQAVEPHRDMLQEMEIAGRAFWGDTFAPYLRGIVNEYYRVHNHIMRNTESLHELRETNNSLLSTKQNEIMKTFTIMAFVTFPLMLVTSAFGMNTVHTPIIGAPFDFWIVIGIMLGSTIGLYLFFKLKKWL